VIHPALFDASVPHGNHYYWKSEYLADISEKAIETIVGHAQHITSPLTHILLFQLGGAVSQVGEEATAVGRRGAAYVLNIASAWTDVGESERHVA
jgi:hypothetical protein